MSDWTLAQLGSIAERRWGMFTTAQAEAAGVARKKLVRMTASGAIERLTQGVYRMTGAPPQAHEGRRRQTVSSTPGRMWSDILPCDDE